MKAKVVRRVGTAILSPPLLFPPDTEVVGIEILVSKMNGRMEWNVAYVGVVPAKWQVVEQFYRQQYSKEITRWQRPRSGNPKSFIAVLRKPSAGRKEAVFTLLISEGIQGEDLKYTRPRRGDWSSIYAMLPAEELHKQLSSLTGNPARWLERFSIYMPQSE